MKKHEIIKKAINDLKNIYRHGVKLYGRSYADAYYSALLAKFRDIAESPYAYQSVGHLKKDLRRSVYEVNFVH